jgi:hypothetical protein
LFIGAAESVLLSGVNNNSFTIERSEHSFDLFRLSKSKDVVDICSNTLRSYEKEGLPFYKKGKAVYVSKSELEQFIRLKCDKRKQTQPRMKPRAQNDGARSRKRGLEILRIARTGGGYFCSAEGKAADVDESSIGSVQGIACASCHRRGVLQYIESIPQVHSA